MRWAKDQCRHHCFGIWRNNAPKWGNWLEFWNEEKKKKWNQFLMNIFINSFLIIPHKYLCKFLLFPFPIVCGAKGGINDFLMRTKTIQLVLTFGLSNSHKPVGAICNSSIHPIHFHFTDIPEYIAAAIDIHPQWISPQGLICAVRGYSRIHIPFPCGLCFPPSNHPIQFNYQSIHPSIYVGWRFPPFPISIAVPEHPPISIFSNQIKFE